MKKTEKAGQFFSLLGPLGAGKTTYVREWVRKHSPKLARQVVSPTFILHARYNLPAGPVHHLDWYRLNSESEILSLGWEEILSEPFAAIFVEWADKFPSLLPRIRTEISFKHDPRSDDRRIIKIRRIGRRRG